MRSPYRAALPSRRSSRLSMVGRSYRPVPRRGSAERRGASPTPSEGCRRPLPVRLAKAYRLGSAMDTPTLVEVAAQALSALLATWLALTVVTRSTLPVARVFTFLALVLATWSSSIILQRLTTSPEARPSAAPSRTSRPPSRSGALPTSPCPWRPAAAPRAGSWPWWSWTTRSSWPLRFRPSSTSRRRWPSRHPTSRSVRSRAPSSAGDGLPRVSGRSPSAWAGCSGPGTSRIRAWSAGGS